MKKPFLFSLLTLFSLVACNSKKTVPNTDIDVARAFIRDLLDDNFADAQPLMLPDETNQGYLDVTKRKLNNLPKEEQDQYHKADIIINEISNVNDSVTIVNYSNTYKRNSPDKVKVVKVNGWWRVDLKYTFSGNL